MLALQAPKASDLRLVLSAVYCADRIERMGDLAEHIASTARRVHPAHVVPPELRDTFAKLGTITSAMAETLVAHITAPRPGSFAELNETDHQVDDLHAAVLRTITGESWPHGVPTATCLALVTRFYERYADQAVSVAKRVEFVSTGVTPAHRLVCRMVARVRGYALPDGEYVDLYADGDRWTTDPVPGAELVAEGWLVPGLVDAHTHPGAEFAGAPAGRVDAAQAPARARRRGRHGHPLPRPGRRPAAVVRRGPGRAEGVARGPVAGTAGPVLRGLGPPPDATPTCPQSPRHRHDAPAGPSSSRDWGVDDDPVPLDVLRAAVEAVHAVGGRVAVHTQQAAGGAAAVAAGVDSVEHGMCLDPALLNDMAAQGMVLTPTLSVLQASLARWRSARTARASGGTSTARRAHPGLVAAAAEAGVTLLAGTDSLPHGRIIDEVRALAAAGLRPHDALAAASWTARDYLGLPGLEPNAPADAVVYAKRPPNRPGPAGPPPGGGPARPPRALTELYVRYYCRLLTAKWYSTDKGGTMGAMTAESGPVQLAHGRPFTVDDLEAMPDDGNRYELIDGTLLVSPAPGTRHQTMAYQLSACWTPPARRNSDAERALRSASFARPPSCNQTFWSGGTRISQKSSCRSRRCWRSRCSHRAACSTTSTTRRPPTNGSVCATTG